MTRTEAQLAREALDVQDACNLAGVAHSFSRVITDLCAVARERGEGTEWVNTHPVSVLFSDKIASLSHSSLSEVFNHAYLACQDLARGNETIDTMQESLNEHRDLEKP